MKTLIQYINEAKQYFYKSDKLLIYGGDHELDRMFERNIKEDIIIKTLNKFADTILDAINSNDFKINDELVLRNKSTHPYLNLPIKYIKKENNKNYIAIKTGIYKDNFKTNTKIIDKYA